MPVNVKQVREKRKEVDALKLAYDAANQAHKEAEAAAFAASANLRIAKDDFLRGRDALEELGREFALDEGENDYTPPMTFEPPPANGKLLVFPASVLESPKPNEGVTYSLNKNGTLIKEYMGGNGNMIVEIVDEPDTLDKIEGNLSIGPAGTPVPSCTCDGPLHESYCPLAPHWPLHEVVDVDPEPFGPF